MILYLLAEVNLPSPSGTPVTAPAATPFLKLFGGFLAVAAVLLLCMWGLRVLSRRQMGQKKSAQLSVLSRVVLGRDSSVALVQIGSRVLAVGVTKENISLLCEAPAEECLCESAGSAVVDAVGREETAAYNPEDGAPPVDGFLKRFVHNFGIVSGLAKGKQPLRPVAKAQVISAAPSFSDMLRKSQAEPLATQNPAAGLQDAKGTEVVFPADVSPSPVVPVSEEPVEVQAEKTVPSDGLRDVAPKASVDYSATVAQMKNRARLMDSEPPMVLKPVRAVEAAYEKNAALQAASIEAARTGVVYTPSTPPAPVAAATKETLTAPKETKNKEPGMDEMDRLMERVAARRDRLRGPGLGKEQA